MVWEKATCSELIQPGAQPLLPLQSQHFNYFLTHFINNCVTSIKYNSFSCNTSSFILNIKSSDSFFVLLYDKAVFHLQTVKSDKLLNEMS